MARTLVVRALDPDLNFARINRPCKRGISKGVRMNNWRVAVLTAAMMLATGASAAEPTQVEKVQAALDAWLAAQAPIEKVAGIAAYISFGDTGPALEAVAGKAGRDPDSQPVDQG